MPAKPLSDAQAKQAAEAYKRLGTEGNKLIGGLSQAAFETRVTIAVDRGFVSRKDRRTVSPDKPMPEFIDRETPVVVETQADVHAIRTALGKAPMTIDEIAERFDISRGKAMVCIEQLVDSGANVQAFSGRYSIQHAPAPRHEVGGELPIYQSRPDNTYLFGFTSDNHLGSKYSRLDVLEDLYDQFAAQGVDRVLNAGNWIDGEARFNMHDLLVHGMDRQVKYLAENYPSRPGIVTYAIAGDDHEGWYCQREGVDIGRYAERSMRDAGRTDWVDMGYMEAYIRLVNANTGQDCKLHLMHPGGGSAYAISYTTQKIVEAYDGGDKPAILLAGHYHKLSYNIVRNVHCIQTGTTEDQTPFMRKKKLAAHVGGGICKVTQDPDTGAITSCRVEFFTYFVKSYYNDRWSHSGDVRLAARL